MKYLGIIIAGLILCLSTAAQAAVDIQRMLQETVKFTDTSYSYSQNQREIHLQFSFPNDMANNNNFRTQSWVIFSSTFDDIEDCKDYIVNNLAEDIDMRFIIYNKNNEKDNPIAQINLNWNNVRRAWEHQRGSTYNEPWYFSVPYTVSKEIADSKAPLYGAIRIKDEDGKQFYSGSVVIQYDSSCTKRCPPNQKLNTKTCECVCKKECPPFHSLDSTSCECMEYTVDVNSFREAGVDIGRSQSIKIEGKPAKAYPLFLASPLDRVLPNRKGKIEFLACRWTINALLNISDNSDVKQKWSKLLYVIESEIKKNKGKHNLTIAIQGSADDGGKEIYCGDISKRTEIEQHIYKIVLPQFECSNCSNNTSLSPPNFKPAGRYSPSNPVKNEDLPNLRALFIRSLFTLDGELGHIPVAIIHGLAIPGHDPNDRCASIFLLESSSDIVKDHPDQFGQ